MLYLVRMCIAGKRTSNSNFLRNQFIFILLTLNSDMFVMLSSSRYNDNLGIRVKHSKGTELVHRFTKYYTPTNTPIVYYILVSKLFTLKHFHRSYMFR